MSTISPIPSNKGTATQQTNDYQPPKKAAEVKDTIAAPLAEAPSQETKKQSWKDKFLGCLYSIGSWILSNLLFFLYSENKTNSKKGNDANEAQKKEAENASTASSNQPKVPQTSTESGQTQAASFKYPISIPFANERPARVFTPIILEQKSDDAKKSQNGSASQQTVERETAKPSKDKPASSSVKVEEKTNEAQKTKNGAASQQTVERETAKPSKDKPASSSVKIEQKSDDAKKMQNGAASQQTVERETAKPSKDKPAVSTVKVEEKTNDANKTKNGAASQLAPGKEKTEPSKDKPASVNNAAQNNQNASASTVQQAAAKQIQVVEKFWQEIKNMGDKYKEYASKFELLENFLAKEGTKKEEVIQRVRELFAGNQKIIQIFVELARGDRKTILESALPQLKKAIKVQTEHAEAIEFINLLVTKEQSGGITSQDLSAIFPKLSKAAKDFLLNSFKEANNSQISEEQLLALMINGFNEPRMAKFMVVVINKLSGLSTIAIKVSENPSSSSAKNGSQADKMMAIVNGIEFKASMARATQSMQKNLKDLSQIEEAAIRGAKDEEIAQLIGKHMQNESAHYSVLMSALKSGKSTFLDVMNVVKGISATNLKYSEAMNFITHFIDQRVSQEAVFVVYKILEKETKKLLIKHCPRINPDQEVTETELGLLLLNDPQGLRVQLLKEGLGTAMITDLQKGGLVLEVISA